MTHASQAADDPPPRRDRIAQFLRYYAAIHEAPGAYGNDDATHRAAAQSLYEQSRPFIDAFAWDEIDTVLDVGCGYGFHCADFAARGKRVTGLTVHATDQLRAHAQTHSYTLVPADMHFTDARDAAFDLVWSSHSLEHAFSQLLALREWYRILKPGAVLAVSVPPHKSTIVSGHFCTGWSVGQLAYMLAVAGFDLRDAYLAREGYNVRALVRRPLADFDPTGASWIDRIADRLPAQIAAALIEHPSSQGRLHFEGDLREIGSIDAFFRSRQPAEA